jgi:peroxiredoxin
MDMELEKFKAEGAQVVAISAQLPEDTAQTQERFGIGMPVLSDIGMAVTELYGIEWEMPVEIREKTNAFVKDATDRGLADLQGDEGLSLPIPATYVIDENGVIAYAYADENYRERVSNDTILRALRALNE